MNASHTLAKRFAIALALAIAVLAFVVLYDRAERHRAERDCATHCESRGTTSREIQDGWCVCNEPTEGE